MDHVTGMIATAFIGNTSAAAAFLSSFNKCAIDILSADGNTLPHTPAGRDYIKEILQVLIDHGADVNATDMFDFTALMWSCHTGNSDAMNVLLNGGADPNITNIIGDTCLHAAVIAICSKEVVQALLDHGADVKARNKENHTALMLASKKRNLDVMKLLTHAQNNPSGANTCVDTMDLD